MRSRVRASSDMTPLSFLLYIIIRFIVKHIVQKYKGLTPLSFLSEQGPYHHPREMSPPTHEQHQAQEGYRHPHMNNTQTHQKPKNITTRRITKIVIFIYYIVIYFIFVFFVKPPDASRRYHDPNINTVTAHEMHNRPHKNSIALPFLVASRDGGLFIDAVTHCRRNATAGHQSSAAAAAAGRRRRRQGGKEPAG